MSNENLIGYTVIFSYRCSCGASNVGSVRVQAQTEYAALRLAYAKPMVCSSCGNVEVRDNIKANVQML
jgi:hypothetical protein